MDKFIKKNIFLVGVLAIAAVSILLLLVMAAMKYMEMHKHREATEDMRNRFAMLNNSRVLPFVRNIALVQKDAEGFRNRAENLKIFFGRVKEPALAIFVYDLNKQALDELAKAFEVFDKSEEFAKQRKSFDEVHKKFTDGISEFEKMSAQLHKLQKELKVLETSEDTQEGKLRVVQEQGKKIADTEKALDVLREETAKNFAAAQKQRQTFFEYINNCCNSDNMSNLMKEKDKAEDAKFVEFYRGICSQNVTPEMMKSIFRDFWRMEKDMLGPREQTYRRFVNERGATPERPANDPSKPVLWDTKLWESSMDVFTREIQKITPEEIDSRNREEIFLSSLGLYRNLGKSASRLEAHSRKMNDAVKAILDRGNVFNSGIGYRQKALPQLKDNKGFVDVGDKRSSQSDSSSSSSEDTKNGGALLTANPADVIRHWEIVGDVAKRMVNANIDSLLDFSYVNLAGDSSNSNYKKFTYIITIVGREVELRDFLKQLNDAYKDNRIYVVKRFELKKQEDQIQVIIDKAQGVLDNKSNDADDRNQGVGSGNMNDNSDGKNAVKEAAVFVEKGVYPECIAGRSTFCQARIVVDYIEFSKDEVEINGN